MDGDSVVLKLAENIFMIQKPDELPNLVGIKELFLDVETTSYDKKRGGDSPYNGDRICGVSVTVEDDPKTWYVPIRHTDESWNLPLEPVQRWLQSVMHSHQDWINHNVLFDAHFCAQDGAVFQGRLIDTLTLSKLVYSDRMSYGLKTLAVEWLKISTEERDRLDSYLDGIKSKNFADAPADLLGLYACKDVFINRQLWRHLQALYNPEFKKAWDNEILLTPVLYDIEDFGMPVDKQELKIEKFKSFHKQLACGAELLQLTGMEINPNSPNDMVEVFVNHMNLPILAINEDEKANTYGNPCFDKDAMELYMIHPAVLADPVKLKTVKLIREYRNESHFSSLFLNTYDELSVEGILHPSYNQCVRTGRMSCRNPNAQQLNKRAKSLIHTRPGYAIISADYSQIEFRLIVHYINDLRAIERYNKDPETDFHQWVADICGVKRKAAKCLNFGMGFGAGKKKVVKMLSGNPDVIEAVGHVINDMIAKGQIESGSRNIVFANECADLCNKLYNTYHQELPGIKQTSYRAGKKVKERGYIFNAYGRRRYLPPQYCYKGFNGVVQSCAADVMKEAIVKLSPRYNKMMRDYDYHIFALVHDDISGMAPVEVALDPKFQREVKIILENPSEKFSLPITTEMGYSLQTWADATCDEPIIRDGKTVASPISFVTPE